MCIKTITSAVGWQSVDQDDVIEFNSDGLVNEHANFPLLRTATGEHSVVIQGRQ